MPSFDTVLEPNLVEVRNAVDQCNKEIGTRFDFKGSGAQVELADKGAGKRELTLHGDSEFQIGQVRDIVLAKMTKRNVDVRFLDFTAKIEKAGGDKVRKSSLGGVKAAAEMINLLGNNTEGVVLENIRAHDPDLAQKIMDKMFVFDDVMKLDDKSIQTVLKEVASETLVVALKGAAPELREKFLSNMSSRAGEALREDLESRGPMRLSEVEAQQKEILKTVRRLSDEGQIVIGGAGDEAFV